MLSNKEIARVFEELALRMAIADEPFKERAYRRAAELISNLGEPIANYRDKLTELPGIGKAIAKKIVELLETGKLRKLEELRKELPVDVMELSKVEGLGPKKLKMLWEKLDIKNIKELKRVAEQGKLRNLAGFGEKTEKALLEAINYIETANRHSLGVVLPLAERIAGRLREFGLADKIDICGSLRRRKDTIGDMDLLAVSDEPEHLMDIFTSLEFVEKVLVKGATKTSVIVSPGIQVDLRVVSRDSYGSALQYFTGSKQHNIELRSLAKSLGYKLSEYGLFKGSTCIAGREEVDIYKALGLSYIVPEMREARGEIELATNHNLPKLVEPSDIKGDLHLHSTWSDGSATIEDLARKAIELGYSYIAITDHCGRLKISGALSSSELKQQWKEIDKLNKKLAPFRILKGVEIEISITGELSLPLEFLKQLDIVIASVHTGLKHTKEEMTRRICRAMENPYVTVIAHPTGRLLGKRPGYELAMDTVFKKAAETGTLLEINAHPLRLDLNDVYAFDAKKFTLLVIDTDSHTLAGMDNMRYGLFMARRAWCSPSHILNTFSLNKLLNWLSKPKKQRLALLSQT